MSEPPLAEIQHEFFGALLKSLRGESRASTELPPSDEPHEADFLATAEKLLRQAPTLSPAECLELYHRQYWFRILDSLEEDFPGLIRLLGREEFWRIAEAYLLALPSQSYTLRHLGNRFSHYLGEHLFDPTLRRRAVAVAEIEAALMKVFEAPDVVPATPERIAGGSRMTLHPAVILLDQFVNASDWLQDESTEWLLSERADFHSVVWRSQTHALNHVALPAGAAQMLGYLRDSPTTLNQWLRDCAHHVPSADVLTQWFAQWNANEWLVVASEVGFASPDEREERIANYE